MTQNSAIKKRISFLLLVSATAFCSLFYYILWGKGIYLVGDDFNTQMFPFLLDLRRMISHGLDTYSWDLDLGSSAIQGYSYYGMGSPFVWIFYLVPESVIPYLIGWVYLLKYVIAAWTSFLFIRRFTNEESYAMAGAFLYAFSGFQSTNIVFYHFHDVVALFPLLLISLERILENVEKGDKHSEMESFLLFTLAVFINCLCSYIFFIQDVIILVVYFLLRNNWRRPWKKSLLSVLLCFAGGLLGTGMASVLFVPSVLYIMGNRRTNPNFSLNQLLYTPRGYLFLLKGFLLPGEAMYDHSSVIVRQWDSTSCFLPFTGLCLVIAYILKRRNWLSRMLVVFLILSLSPIANAGFMLFTISYERWWYVLILMMSVATSQVIEKADQYPIMKGVVIQAVLVAVFLLDIAAAAFISGKQLVFHPLRLLLLVLIVLTSSAFLLRIISHHDSAASLHRILIGIAVVSVITTMYAQYGYRKGDATPPEYDLAMYHAARLLPAIDDQYRYRNNHNMLIYASQNKNTSGSGSYSSTVANVLQDLDEAFDYYTIDRRLNKNTVAGAAEYLGGKYYFDSELIGNRDRNLGDRFPEELKRRSEIFTEYEINGVPCYIYQTDSNPIGYASDYSISYEELKKLPVEYRGIALLWATVLEDPGSMRDLLQEIRAEDVYSLIHADPGHMEGDALFSNRAIHELTANNMKNAVMAFQKNEKGFSCETDFTSPRAIFFSIPNDAGWTIKIDDETATPIDSAGLIVLSLSAGHHYISAVYETPGYKAGAIVSCISLSMYLFMMLWYELSYRKHFFLDRSQ